MTKGTIQKIRITEGCPWSCPFCYEPPKMDDYGIPQITSNTVEIMDMNLLSHEGAIEIIKQLGDTKVDGKVVRYELIPGVDYRVLTQEQANALKKARFTNMHIAWDWGLDQQMKIKQAIQMLENAGYRTGYRTQIGCFMIGNWKITPKICERKLDALKVWGVRVADCWYNGYTRENVQPIHWTPEEIERMKPRFRKHNHVVNYDGMDPEIKEGPIP